LSGSIVSQRPQATGGALAGVRSSADQTNPQTECVAPEPGKETVHYRSNKHRAVATPPVPPHHTKAPHHLRHCETNSHAVQAIPQQTKQCPGKAGTGCGPTTRSPNQRAIVTGCSHAVTGGGDRVLSPGADKQCKSPIPPAKGHGQPPRAITGAEATGQHFPVTLTPPPSANFGGETAE
jgi:hypothetical protein